MKPQTLKRPGIAQTLKTQALANSKQKKRALRLNFISSWRKREDSNLRDIAAHTISSRAPSTTRPRFHLLSYHI